MAAEALRQDEVPGYDASEYGISMRACLSR